MDAPAPIRPKPIKLRIARGDRRDMADNQVRPLQQVPFEVAGIPKPRRRVVVEPFVMRD